jgi:hypothetical protein
MTNGKMKMTRNLLWAAAISAAALMMAPAAASAQDGIFYKVRSGDSNYCHMKFPAISEHTLASNRPVLQDPNAGAIIDFYGSCDYDPTGKEAVAVQKRDRQRLFPRQYAD